MYDSCQITTMAYESLACKFHHIYLDWPYCLSYPPYKFEGKTCDLLLFHEEENNYCKLLYKL